MDDVTSDNIGKVLILYDWLPRQPMALSAFEDAMFKLLSFPKSVREKPAYWQVGCVDGYVTVSKSNGTVKAHFRMREDRDEDMKVYEYKAGKPFDRKMKLHDCHSVMASFLDNLEV